MKFKFIKCTSVLLCLVLSVTAFSGCYRIRKPSVKTNGIDYSCDFKRLNDGSLTGSVKLSEKEYIDIDFTRETEFDTVELYENGDNCNEFNIYVEKNGQWELVYKQDRIMHYHLCFLGKHKSQKIRLEIADCNKNVKIKELTVSLAKKRTQPVRVTQYLRFDVCDFETLLNDEGFSGYYDVVTDPIIFGEVYMDSNANICFYNSEEHFAKQLSNLKKIIADRDVRIWSCIFFDQTDDGGNKNHDATMDFVNNNIDKISENIRAFTEKYGLYGIDYDWEYPRSRAQWKAYDLMVEETAKFTKVSVALPPWQIRFSSSARKAVENVNIMAYDLFDTRGDHSNCYNGGYEAIAKVREFGFDDSQLLLGIPTYGRTTDKSEYAWPTIRDDGGDFGKWGKLVKDYPYTDSDTGEKKTCDAYLNSYAEARDKTAVAIDEGIGGVMIFRAFCDAPHTNEFSLHRAIGETIEERTDSSMQ